MRDILKIVQSRRRIKPTPLLRKSNLSSSGFKEYFNELKEKGFVREINDNGKAVIITEQGSKFLEKYQNILSFIEEFEL